MNRSRLAAIITCGLIISTNLISSAPAHATQYPTINLDFGKVALSANNVGISLSSVNSTGALHEGYNVTVTKYPSANGSLSNIARGAYGNEGLWNVIFAANRNKISDPNFIDIGWTLWVPKLNGNTQKPPTSNTSNVDKPQFEMWVHPLASEKRGGSCWGAPRKGHTHKGVDISEPSGTAIRAAHAGKVNLIKYQKGGAGHYVVLDHLNGIYTVYMHMIRRPNLTTGQNVSAGQTIGNVGSTGSSTGPHLHFEVHRGLWNQINPGPYMRSVGVNIGC